MPLPGHPIVVEVSLDDVTYTEIDGINDVSFGNQRDMLMTTDFKDTTGAKTRIAGLKDGTVTISGDLELGDTNGQNKVRAKYDDGAACWISVKFDPGASAGSRGFKVQGIVENSEIKTVVDGKNEWSASIPFNAVPVAV